MNRQIIAISGGGFSTEENAYIDQYLLKIPRKQDRLKITFIATASNDAQGYIGKFYEAFKEEEPSHLTIQDFALDHVQEMVNASDIIYVGGGNTQYMLTVWRETGFDNVLKQAYEQGVILAGISAGALCWFERCYSESHDDGFEEFQGLGILQGTFCPHYNDKKRQVAFDQWTSKQDNMFTYALNDNESLHFINEQVVAKIRSYTND
ncbi:Type 1 glutamine amidotransferase-like domain-containing protein [Lysinibacillus piscis]|uniref:Peptidase YgaJ n=1 Tax=Lysinibacillus piscis TaxID=2518931 RepID=A0ABQ5NMR2_9BACI|nr:peptidase E [Lysinibacillus sp. KH24]GLC89603.1 putative peptidase YgaJ [Lysinibacillus sp. KH24]